MRKLSTLLGNTPDNQLRRLTQQTNTYLQLAALWNAAIQNSTVPKIIGDLSSVGQIHNGELTIYAHNATIATKIKLSNASLLTQLQKLQSSERRYGECKVTAIKVKVQVKSPAPKREKSPRQLSSHASQALNRLANQLGDSTLSQKLKKLAAKS